MTGITVLACGGRNYSDTLQIATTLSAIHEERGISRLIQGNALGADFYAAEWARGRNIPVGEFPALWHKHGHRAGPIRNQRMIDEGKPDLVVAFPGGRGTTDMVRRARAAGIEVLEA